MFTAKELNEMSKEAPKRKEAVDKIMDKLVPVAVERAGFGFFDATFSLSQTEFRDYSPQFRRLILQDIIDELHSYDFDVHVAFGLFTPVSQVLSYEELQECEVLLETADSIRISWTDR